ncbi:polysaccharide deacetylase family protein [Planotetraspora sp. GP83]|uniref:polysaccharide deacetylase family protein n=1 Tax=Planotetraspora sp. GP83 TaxID=3156264 RepID=UPI003511311D
MFPSSPASFLRRAGAVALVVPVLVMAAGQMAEARTTGAVTTGAATTEHGSPKVTTVVALTFDDGDASHVRVARLLKSRGMAGTFYVNSAQIGTAGKLTRAQLAAIARAGHEIGGHTLTHPKLPELTPAEQRAEICDDRRALLAMGFQVRTFAYPYGAWDGSAKRIVRACGYNGARGVGGLSSRPCAGCEVAEPYRPESLYLVRTPGSVRETTTLAQIKESVLNAEKAGGGLVPLVFHRLCADDGGCGVYSVSDRTLTAFLDWLAGRRTRGTVVRTLGAAIGGKVRPLA